MKTFLKVALVAMGLCCTTPALAMSGSAVDPDTFQLTCVPPLDHSERDPIVRIHVLVTFKPLDMKVVHESYAGRRYDRAAQYTDTEVKNSAAATSWHGTLRSDLRREIIGAVIVNDNDEGFYVETYYRDGREIGSVVAPCEIEKMR
jgi:hypothetical protein